MLFSSFTISPSHRHFSALCSAHTEPKAALQNGPATEREGKENESLQLMRMTAIDPMGCERSSAVDAKIPGLQWRGVSDSGGGQPPLASAEQDSRGWCSSADRDHSPPYSPGLGVDAERCVDALTTGILETGCIFMPSRLSAAYRSCYTVVYTGENVRKEKEEGGQGQEQEPPEACDLSFSSRVQWRLMHSPALEQPRRDGPNKIRLFLIFAPNVSQ